MAGRAFRGLAAPCGPHRRDDPDALGPGDPLGPLALALGPRSLGGFEPPRADWVRVRTSAPLPAALAERLSCSDLRTTALRSGASVEGPRAALAELAADVPEAAALLSAHDLACRPRDPARLMGILNVTPDSFSDGGLWDEPEREGVPRGAHLIDVGGESTRPGATPVDADVERARVVPVIEAIAGATDVPISIDTRKASVARAAIEAGASVVNDISAGTHDPELLPAVAEAGVELVLMHMRGTPRTMQRDPHYEDAPTEVIEALRRRARAARDAGVAMDRIALDPGIGFGKRLEDNLALVRSLRGLRSLGAAVLVGLSRKSFLGALTGTDSPLERDLETAAATSLADLAGADVHRVHDVSAARRALAVARGLAHAPDSRAP